MKTFLAEVTSENIKKSNIKSSVSTAFYVGHIYRAIIRLSARAFLPAKRQHAPFYQWT